GQVRLLNTTAFRIMKTAGSSPPLTNPFSLVFLAVAAHQAAEDSLDLDAGRVNLDGLHSGIRRPELNFLAETEEPFEGRARAVNQGDDDFTVAGIVATFNQCDVA